MDIEVAYDKHGEILGLILYEKHLFIPRVYVDDNKNCEYYNCYNYSTDDMDIEIIPVKKGIVTLKARFTDAENNFCKENISLQEAIDIILSLIEKDPKTQTGR